MPEAGAAPAPYLSVAAAPASTRLRSLVLLSWLLLLGGLITLYIEPAWDGAQVAASGGQEIDQALWVADSAPVTWRLVDLPHALSAGPEGETWRYRLSFDLSPAQAAMPLGLCMARRTLAGEVWLDGQLLADAAVPEPISLRWTWPQRRSLPPGLAAGRHLLELRLIAPPFPLEAQLSRIWLGPAGIVARGCDGAVARISGLSAMMLGIMLAAGALALVVGWSLNDRAAKWFAVAAATWGLNQFIYTTDLLLWTGLTPASSARLAPVLRLLVTVTLAMFVLRHVRIVWPRRERGLALFTAVAVLVMLLVPAAQGPLARALVSLPVVFIGITLLWVVARHAWRQSSLSADALLLSLVYLIAVASLELMRRFGWLSVFPWGMAILVVPSLTGAIGLLMAERLGLLYRRQLAAAGWMKAELRRQQDLLQHSFDALRAQRDAEVESESRRRIMRELHDGLGSHLVSAAALLASERPLQGERGMLSALVDRSLQELRSALDAITSDAGDVAELLGALRDRIEPVLAARGIELDWQVAALPGTQCLGVAERLDVLRIVQEVFANVVKHAGACRVSVRAWTTPAGASLIVIADDGPGLQAGRAEGMGLPSMRERAARLRAGLACEDAAPGLRVTLALPATVAAAPAAWDGAERREVARG